jgi:hypothetical protein
MNRTRVNKKKGDILTYVPFVRCKIDEKKKTCQILQETKLKLYWKVELKSDIFKGMKLVTKRVKNYFQILIKSLC